MGLLRATMIAFYLSNVMLGTSSKGPDEDQIISKLDAFHKHFRHPNPEALYDQIYDPEAYSMPPGEKAVKGKANTLSMLSRFTERMKELTLRNKWIEMFGNIAVQVCRYEEEGTNGQVLETGKGVIIWKKDPVTKQWKVLYDIWNENSKSDDTL